MKIAVTGAKGRLGSWLVRSGAHPLDCDITSVKSVHDAFEFFEPDVIINCAAFSGVDACEDEEHSERAMKVNMWGPGNLRRSFEGYFVQISTGFVFDGEDGPYDEEVMPRPINWYGWTKFGGESAAMLRGPTLVVRVLDLFGPGPKTDFVREIRDVLELGQPYDLPSTLYGSPTYIPHLAEALLKAIETGITGILNIAGDQVLSRYEWGKCIAEHFGYDPDLIRSSKSIKGSAMRPLRGGLKIDLAREKMLPIYSPIEGLAQIAEGEDDEALVNTT